MADRRIGVIFNSATGRTGTKQQMTHLPAIAAEGGLKLGAMSPGMRPACPYWSKATGRQLAETACRSAAGRRWIDVPELRL